MTRQRFLVLIASGGSAALLLGALGFQYLGGLAPCPLCILQRWPHLAAVLIGALALWLGGRLLPLLGALAALTTAGIGLFHAGVELKWWEGLQSCSSGSIAGLSAADLLDPSKDIAAVVRCDAIAWQMFGLSMAGWNMVISLGLALVWLAAARRA
ncbi:disulfide bond formation protein B [Gemmobacter fulvus]|uniref:Disulfide bond formation protein B n=1 Tax=Gemmobacter fulvus TaxID=2840474 RepID=A0A975S0P5_9RHOB|nr:disulfide bond formation protein B [Gemmobacter fulvus]MBT9245330.1 disulfide bond formation protein B [Gemmobacter fulvus]QWK90349.1 disulfide bond formation protein B [Gemmobacter fulvus]